MMSPISGSAQFWEQHWIDSNYVFSGSGGDVLLATQTTCEEGDVRGVSMFRRPLPPTGKATIDLSAWPVLSSVAERPAAGGEADCQKIGMVNNNRFE
ncbi:MAG: hypothetical protein KDC75_25960 [Phaeodactylibacter sp.]|nr:hypothetical protein [Phaeodactylibacter sp.]